MIHRSSPRFLAILAVFLLPLVLLELLGYLILTLLLLAFLALAPEAGHKPEKDARAGALRRARQCGGGTNLLREVLQDRAFLEAGNAEELVDEVCRTLECRNLSPKVVRGLRDSLGESCLFLSGGGMLGMYHLGTVRRLLEEGVLPKQLCGTSVGSIVGAFVTTRTDAELAAEFESLEEWFRQMGPEHGPFPVQYWEVVLRVLWRGYIYDYMDQYRNQATFVSNGLTFQEAYERTGRTLTITCAPVAGGDVRLLNRHTAPNVLIASAVCASSSMPMLVQAVQLLERRADGSIGAFGSLVRDGTMIADAPREQLREMLNVRWSIISQVNPHVVPLCFPSLLAERASRSARGRSLAAAEGHLRRLIWSTLGLFQTWTGLPKRGQWISNLLFQDYFGDVNIVHHEMRFIDYLRLIKNETTLADFRGKVAASAAVSEKQVERQRLRRKLEDALKSLDYPLRGRPRHGAQPRRTRA